MAWASSRRWPGSPRMPTPDTLPGVEDAVALGLTRDEYALIVGKLGGRPPNQVELAKFSLLWSEHFAFKHSQKVLMTPPTQGPAVGLWPRVKAGAVDPCGRP